MNVLRARSRGGRVLPLALVTALVLGMSACGGDSDDNGSAADDRANAEEQQIRTVYAKYVDDLTAGNGAAACEAMTARMQRKATAKDETCADRMNENAALVQMLKERPRILALARDGDEYRARITTGIGESVLWFREDDGGWKIHRGSQEGTGGNQDGSADAEQSNGPG